MKYPLSAILQGTWFYKYVPPKGMFQFKFPTFKVTAIDPRTSTAQLARMGSTKPEHCHLSDFGRSFLDQVSYQQFLQSHLPKFESSLKDGFLIIKVIGSNS